MSVSTVSSATGACRGSASPTRAHVPADLVVVGLGVTPATDWLKGSGLRVDDGVVCDAAGAAEGASGVVAAGDVARWWHPLYDRHLRTEHWDTAGRRAPPRPARFWQDPIRRTTKCRISGPTNTTPNFRC